MDAPADSVLILAPLGRDADMMAAALRSAGLPSRICRQVDDVASVLRAAGALLIAEEALTPSALARLLPEIAAQPPWSDVPVVVLTRSGRMAEPGPVALQAFHKLGNVTLLERPVRVMTLISTMESAVRARRRQYEVRDHLVTATMESQAKDEFLAMLGHELRNPLSAIAAACHLLDMAAPAEGDASASARRVIARQLRHLTRLVDDLLDVSRVTRGKIELTRRPLDVAVAVTNCVAALRAAGRLEERSVEVEVAATPAWVEADEVRFDQVVNNLLVNAGKYTPAGGRIVVFVGREGADVVVRVSDTGIGIPADLLPRVFDLFVQGGRGIERTQGGLGIGLTLVRRLVELHGGVVSAHSDGPGRGSAFTVRLPALAEAPAMQAARPPTSAAVSRRVLVIEDHDDARAMIAVMLKDAGHEVYEAADGPSGLAAALRERPDVAVIDVGLPHMNGYEVARRLRATEEARGMLLIALTGYGLPEDRRRAAEAGFDRYLVKPVDFDQLSDVLVRAA